EPFMGRNEIARPPLRQRRHRSSSPYPRSGGPHGGRLVFSTETASFFRVPPAAQPGEACGGETARGLRAPAGRHVSFFVFRLRRNPVKPAATKLRAACARRPG